MKRVSDWVKSHAWLSVVIAFLIGIGVAVAENPTPEEPTAETSSESESVAISDLQAENADLADDLEEANLRADAAEEELADAEARLRKKAADLRAKAGELNRRENKIRSEEQRIAQTTFGDGTWQVGTDIEPGLYRAPGGGSCYWAELNSADNFDIVTNGGFGPNQTVQIDTAWFESRDCGEWKKIG